MTKRLIVGMWREQYFFFIQPGACENWLGIGPRGGVGVWLRRSCQGLHKCWNLVNVAFCLKKSSQSSQYGGSKATVIFSAIAYSLLLFLLLRFSILFLFLSGVYYPVFINPLTLTLFVRAHRRTGSYTLCKVDFFWRHVILGDLFAMCP